MEILFIKFNTIYRCKLQPRAVRINSSALEGVIQNKLREMSGNEVKKFR